MQSTAQTIQISSHAVGVVLVDDSSADGCVLVDRMSYTKRGRSSTRHVMETGEPGESVRETLHSSYHEMAKTPSEFDLELVVEEPIYYSVASDEQHPGSMHLQVWFLARPKGMLRDFVLPDGDETLGPITMVEAESLLKETEGRTVRNHVSATYAALDVLAGERKIFDRYQKLVMGWRRQEFSAELQAAVDEYVSRV